MDVMDATSSLDEWPGPRTKLESVRQLIVRDREQSLQARCDQYGLSPSNGRRLIRTCGSR